VEAILADLLARHQSPTFDTVRDRVRAAAMTTVPVVLPAVLDFRIYDDLLVGEGRRA
jgi:hypothetical protein